ncbi:capsid protein, partial [Kluyvera sp. Nf5]
RHIVENPKLDQVENYEQVKVDFVIEDYEAGCLIENIDILEQDDNDTPEADTVKMIAAELAGAIKALVAAPATSTGEGA